MGGNGFAITLENPAARPMSSDSNSRAEYASPCGVEPQHLKREHGRKRGDTRSSFSKNSTATARPPETRLLRAF